MAPEQLTAGTVTCASDNYAFGLIAYEMLTGRRAFNPDTLFQLGELHRDGLRVRPSDLRPSVPTIVDDILLKALSYDPDDRYSSADALAQALYQALTGKKPGTAPLHSDLVPDATTRRLHGVQTVQVRRTRFAVIAGGVVLLAAICLGLGLLTASLLQRSTAVVNTPPASPVSPAINRSISYYLMVQKRLPNGTEHQKPFRATGNEILGDGWTFTVHTSNSQGGHLYLVNEGPAKEGVSYNLLFPTPSRNGGSTWVPASEFETGSYGLDTNQGTEKFWLVWSAAPVPELEAVKGFVNPKDRGQVSDPKLAEALGAFLSKHWATKPQVEVDKTAKIVSVKSTSDVLVNLLELEHH
jgi:serine/threonine protein kinase